MEQIKRFQQTLNGNPQDLLNKYIQQNQIPQQALDEAQKQANELIKLFRR